MIVPNYHIGNAKDIKKIFTINKIGQPQLVNTSPPYFDLLNYENHKDQIGQNQLYDEYLSDVACVFQDCYELSTESATFWLIIDTFRRDGEVVPLPFDIYNKLKASFKSTWELKEIIIWDKEKNIPWNGNGKFKNEFEYILFFSKNDNLKFNVDRVREINDLKKWWMTYPERYNPSGKAPSNLWRFITAMRGWGTNYQKHLCPFPYPLVEKIISIASDENDLVLDPFAGSGSVLAIASVMGRPSIGIDINKKYKELFEENVLTGAKKYWEARAKELRNNSKAILEYKKTNQKLRKLKVASNIGSYINALNKHGFLYFLINESGKENLYIIENSFKPVVDLKNEKIETLLKQAKVTPNITIVDEDTFFEKFKDLKLYKYKYNKFYSYTSSTKAKAIKDNKDRFDYFYSNIDVKLLGKS